MYPGVLHINECMTCWCVTEIYRLVAATAGCRVRANLSRVNITIDFCSSFVRSGLSKMTARGTERSGHYNDIGCFAEQEHSSRSKSWRRTSTHDDGNLCILSVASIQTEWAFIVLSFIEQCSSPRSRLFYIWFGFPCSTFPLLPSTTSTAYPRFSHDFQSVPSSSSCTIRSSFFPDRSSGRIRRWNFSTSRYNKLTIQLQ